MSIGSNMELRALVSMFDMVTGLTKSGIKSQIEDARKVLEENNKTLMELRDSGDQLAERERRLEDLEKRERAFAKKQDALDADKVALKEQRDHLRQRQEAIVKGEERLDSLKMDFEKLSNKRSDELSQRASLIEDSRQELLHMKAKIEEREKAVAAREERMRAMAQQIGA